MKSLKPINKGKNKNRIIKFFEVDFKSKIFYRVYADLVKFSKFQMIVKIDNGEYIYHSHYNLFNFLYETTLRVFIFPETNMLYPLPLENSYSKNLSRDKFQNLNRNHIEQLIFNDPDVIAITSEFNELQGSIKTKLNYFQQEQHKTINLAEAIKIPRSYKNKNQKNEDLEKLVDKRSEFYNNDLENSNRSVKKRKFKSQKKENQRKIIPIFNKNKILDKKIKKFLKI